MEMTGRTISPRSGRRLLLVILQGGGAWLLARALTLLIEVAAMASMPTDISPSAWADIFEARMAWVSLPASAAVGCLAGLACAWRSPGRARLLSWAVFAVAVVAYHGLAHTDIWTTADRGSGLTSAVPLVLMLSAAAITCLLTSRTGRSGSGPD